MINKIDTKKLDNLINKKFPIIYKYNFDGLLLLYGGAIKDTLTGGNTKDLDFVILSQKECQIKKFLSKYKLNYKKNVFGGYKINYKNTEIDICTTDDLLNVMRYDIDGMFYDIQKQQMILCGPERAYKEMMITEVNATEFFDINRLKKLKRHIQKINKSSKRVKVRQNIFTIIYIKIKKEIKRIFKGRQKVC